MSNYQNQTQTQTQKQGLNTFLLQQKLQILHLMHLPALALEEHIKNQLEENPALEEVTGEEAEESLVMQEAEPQEKNKLNEIEDFFDDDDIPDYKTYANNKSSDEPAYSFTAAYYQSFQEQLKDQLKECDPKPEIKHLVEYLIDSLDEDGYLHTAVDDLTEAYGFAHGHFVEIPLMEEALKVLQKFDPPGIGARSLQECMMLQLERKQTETKEHLLAKEIVAHYFSELSHKNYDKIIKALQISEDDLKEALKVIMHLSPKSVFVASKDLSVSQVIIPEFAITIEDNQLQLSLTNNPSFSIQVNKDYAELLKSTDTTSKNKTEFNYFRKKVDEAKWFVEALQQREHTLLEIMKVITSIQRDFFMTGNKKDLKPMILEAVANRTGYDISTVSRVTCNKYVQTPYGNILLKDLFSSSLYSSDGEAVSSEKIKQIISEIIEQENKSNPFTDIQLVHELKQKGFEIARRTVVKYRNTLRLPNAQMRKAII